MNKSACIILTTAVNQKDAKDIASYLIENGLAACIQIDKLSSKYKWLAEKLNDSFSVDSSQLKGGSQIVLEEECRLMIKSFKDKFELIKEEIMKIHKYEIPQIIKIDINDISKSYLSWMESKIKS